MLNPDKSNELWAMLEVRAGAEKLLTFSSDIKGAGVRVETFTVKQFRDGVGVEVKRRYYRMVRDATGTVLYDQLEGRNGPDIAISPDSSNKLLVAALEQQAEVDRLIEEAKV